MFLLAQERVAQITPFKNGETIFSFLPPTYPPPIAAQCGGCAQGVDKSGCFYIFKKENAEKLLLINDPCLRN